MQAFNSYIDILKDERVLITGVAGFIGSNLCEVLLSHGVNVVGLDNFSNGDRENIKDFIGNKNFSFIEGDIVDFALCEHAVKGCKYVFHQAALGSIPRSIATPILTHHANASGFVNMVFAAQNAKVKRMVYASSSSVYGDEPSLPRLESKVGKPLSPYASSKMANEVYAHGMSQVYDIQLVGLRYFNVFGKRQKTDGPYAAVIPKFIALLLEGKAPKINGDGEQARDFTYIDNVVQANIKSAIGELSSNSEIFNVAYGAQFSVNEIYKTMSDYMLEKKMISSYLAPEYLNERKGDVKNSLGDITKIKKEIGYSPTIAMKEGLIKTIDWFFTNHIKM